MGAKGGLINYSLPQPKWQFLSYLCQKKDLVLHGSQISDIRVVKPRQANDTRAYSNQRAIYATTDGIWVIYILPRESFEREAPQQVDENEIWFPHWISQESARPLARLKVGPEDFPFLAQIHGHNDEKLTRLAAADPNGFPWPDALES